MPGPCAVPEGGKSKFNRKKNKMPHPTRGADGNHKTGSQNRNKNRGKR